MGENFGISSKKNMGICHFLFICSFMGICHFTANSFEDKGFSLPQREIEVLDYMIYKGIFPVGSIKFTASGQKGDKIRLFASVKTNALASLLVSVDSWAESVADPRNFHSFLYHENAYFRGKYYRFFADFDRILKRILIYRIAPGLPRDNMPTANIAPDLGMAIHSIISGVDKNFCDPISLLYRHRFYPEREQKVFLDFDVKKVVFEEEGIFSLNTAIGKKRCKREKVIVDTKAILPAGSQITINITNDSSRLPVYLKFDVPGIGKGRAELRSRKGDLSKYMEMIKEAL